MADDVQVNIPDTAGAIIATDDVAGVQHQKVKVEFGADGVATMVNAANPLPVTDAAAETSLASIDGKLPAGGLATSAKQDTGNASLASIDSKLTNPLPVSTGGLTDTQLRATPVPVSNTNLDVALSTRNLEATQLLIRAKTDNLDVALSTRLKPADTLTAVALNSDIRQATAANLNMTEASAAAIKTAVETIDNFISGARGLVTEDNSASILAVEGATSDATVAAGATGSISAKLRRATQGLEDLKTLIVLATGSNIIGKVGIDQTTPGTTNAIQVINTAAVPAIVNQPQVEGKWLTEIMSQILLELRIQNQYMSELPFVLQGKARRLDEPSLFRNDQSAFVE